MYHHIRGTLTSKGPQGVVVEAGGVGYLLLCSIPTYQALPANGQPVTLLTHLNVKEDALTLYGFSTPVERQFFRQLTENVKGVGPRVALAILSGGKLDRIQQAIRLGDVKTLKGIKGVGEATAKRIVLELGKILVKEAEGDAKPKATKKRSGSNDDTSLAHLDEMTELAVKAIMQLNELSQDSALKAVQNAFEALQAEDNPPKTVQDLIRRALSFAE